MSLYAAFSKYNLNDEAVFIIINCLVYFLDEKEIYIDKFKQLMECGYAHGEFAGIEIWDEDSEEDHGIKEKFDGYLFFLDGDMFNDYGDEDLQVILTNEDIMPFIKDIIDWYKHIPNSRVDEFIKLATKHEFYP
ncbi:hypothetical protein A6M14_13660 [Acinetobacter sp. Ac_877]|uniref:hypothetical protein n=1 Tax=Acinetobacter portensis TaxID=1839785 RepID=UPI00128AF45A|nr:hypothetical protein [Acinetobacter portensis]MPW42801.1 hypothetical protein [Acinetobacter portensis]